MDIIILGIPLYYKQRIKSTAQQFTDYTEFHSHLMIAECVDIMFCKSLLFWGHIEYVHFKLML